MRGADTRTFAAEIGTWLDSNRLDLQGQQSEVDTILLQKKLGHGKILIDWTCKVSRWGVDTILLQQKLGNG